MAEGRARAAFLRDAPFAILDEPTAALDARAEHDVFARIRELFASRSVLLISHRFSTVGAADRIYVLDGGRIVEAGGHAELMVRRERAPAPVYVGTWAGVVALVAGGALRRVTAAARTPSMSES